MWLELRLASAWPDFAEEALFAEGAQAVRQIDAADDPVLEPPPGATPLWDRTITSGIFAAGVDLDAIEAAVRALLPDGAGLEASRRVIEDADWQESWKAHVRPLSFGEERLWICPTHEVCESELDAAIVTLDPGLAFGTGTHQSTALCLEWLATHELGGARVLDYGCGSGILAIASLKLGAKSALAIDIDPQALLATRANSIANGLEDRLVCAGPEHVVDQPVDIVLANILAKPLIELSAKLTASLRPGGSLVLAGLLDRQAEEVRAAYLHDFDFEPDVSLEGWTRLYGIRKASVAE